MVCVCYSNVSVCNLIFFVHIFCCCQFFKGNDNHASYVICMDVRYVQDNCSYYCLHVCFIQLSKSDAFLCGNRSRNMCLCLRSIIVFLLFRNECYIFITWRVSSYLATSCVLGQATITHVGELCYRFLYLFF